MAQRERWRLLEASRGCCCRAARAALLGRGRGAANQLLQLRALGRVLLRDSRPPMLAHDHVGLGHSVSYLRNGKLKASSNARPCLLSRAVVVIVISMPRTWSTVSYWISGKMICSLTPRL